MKRLLKKARAGLLYRNSLKKYALYSLGEILLVVIGILIAIQVDNWNEARIQGNQFKADLEQIYNTLDRDIDVLTYGVHGFNTQIAIIDSILTHPNHINRKLLPHQLTYVDITPAKFHSEIGYQLEHLSYNRQDDSQRALAKSLSEYANTLEQNEIISIQHVTPIYQQEHLSQPTMIFGISNLNNFNGVDLSFFGDEEIATVTSLLQQQPLRNALKSLASLKQANVNTLNQIMLSARAKQKAIKQYHPTIRLLYTGLGIVGSGTVNGWDNDIALTATDNAMSKWEGDVTLTDGEIKFRNERNWVMNWGGTSFPKGQMLFNGDNIKTTAGTYHVVFDLNEKTYEFIKKED